MKNAMPATALIVEDEIFVALDLERILVDAGYAVKAIAADRDGAIDAARDCSFALVDINLRDGPTGPELARTLARDYGVKVVFRHRQSRTDRASQRGAWLCPQAVQRSGHPGGGGHCQRVGGG